MSHSNEEPLKKEFRALGLTDAESKVYIFLARSGPLKGGEIARSLKIPKAQVYHILKSLQSKAWTQSTMEFPARFTATPLAEIVDAQVKQKKEEALSLQGRKHEILSRWLSLDQNTIHTSTERFAIIEGRNKIAAKIFQMIGEVTEEIAVIFSGPPLEQIIYAGAVPAAIKKFEQSQIRMKILLQVSKENLKILNQTLAELSRKGLMKNVEVRHLEDSNFHCRLIIKDRQELILHLTAFSPTSTKYQEETAVWTNGEAVIACSNTLFDCLWSNASDASLKLREISST